MSAMEQPALPGTKAPQPQRKARVFKEGRQWVVTTPNPYGKPERFEAGSWRAAIRFLDRVRLFRRRKV